MSTSTPSLRLLPSPAHPTTTPLPPSAPSAPGIPDTLRAALSPPPTTTHQPNSSHPLETHLASSRSAALTLQHTLLRHAHGLADPLRRGMELHIVGRGEWRPAGLGGSSGVHGDVLMGRDAEVGWEDVFTGGEMGGMAAGRGDGLGELERWGGLEGV